MTRSLPRADQRTTATGETSNCTSLSAPRSAPLATGGAQELWGRRPLAGLAADAPDAGREAFGLAVLFGAAC